jgi:tricorn protease
MKIQRIALMSPGGAATKLPIPNAAKAAYSPDGKTIAYLPLGERFRQWKRYRGGTASRILLFDTSTYAVEQVPQPTTRCNDTDPSWVGDELFFRSAAGTTYPSVLPSS